MRDRASGVGSSSRRRGTRRAGNRRSREARAERRSGADSCIVHGLDAAPRGRGRAEGQRRLDPSPDTERAGKVTLCSRWARAAWPKVKRGVAVGGEADGDQDAARLRPNVLAAARAPTPEARPRTWRGAARRKGTMPLSEIDGPPPAPPREAGRERAARADRPSTARRSSSGSAAELRAEPSRASRRVHTRICATRIPHEGPRGIALHLDGHRLAVAESARPRAQNPRASPHRGACAALEFERPPSPAPTPRSMAFFNGPLDAGIDLGSWRVHRRPPRTDRFPFGRR